MAHAFKLVIAKVDETLFEGQVVSVTVPGAAGEMTILANHEAIASTLKKGTVVVRTADDTKKFSIEGGILECSQGRAVVLL